MSDAEIDDLTRYLDVTRAELLFARGVILVEGDAERFLVPAFAATMNKLLDSLGITICSVGGTNFVPYAKLLTGLKIPFSIITDWDPGDEDSDPLGHNRTRTLVSAIEQIRTGVVPKAVLDELDAIEDPNEFCDRCEAFGIFSNVDTLEVDLFAGKFIGPIIKTLREGDFGKKRNAWIDGWKKDIKSLDRDNYLKLIEAIGKGCFAQRLVAHMEEAKPPRYIKAAIEFVASHV